MDGHVGDELLLIELLMFLTPNLTWLCSLSRVKSHIDGPIRCRSLLGDNRWARSPSPRVVCDEAGLRAPAVIDACGFA